MATENDDVHAIDARSGNQIWTPNLGRPVPLSSQPCGNIDPLGITGTPAIDEATQAVYLDAMVGDAFGAHHRIFALSLKDGSPLPGWPVDVAEALAPRGQHFNTRFQNQRGALAILDSRAYVPYGGHFGDCSDYHGWVLGIRLPDPRNILSWSTRGRGGGIWAPGGISSDGHALFVATGNTLGVGTWSDGEAVFRLLPDLRHEERSQDFFAPADWPALDERDADLGGIGGSLASETVSTYPIRTAPAVYPIGGSVFVAFQGGGANCSTARSDNSLTVLRIRAGEPPSLATAWCAAFREEGSPIVTTTGGRANPIVGILGAEGDGRLHGYRGDSGEPLFAGGGAGDAMR